MVWLMVVRMEEELEALKAVFCLPGECSVLENLISVRLCIQTGSNYPDSAKENPSLVFTLVIDIGNKYPHDIPIVSIFSEHAGKALTSKVKEVAKQVYEEANGEPMLVALVLKVQDFLKEHFNISNVNIYDIDLDRAIENMSELDLDNDNVNKLNYIYTSILQIDHMRSKAKYSKTLVKWASSFNLTGKLVFCQKLILVVLQGCLANIKAFIVQLKTETVDVDSRGHSCKERMMKVLCEEKHSPHEIVMFTDFQLCEIPDVAHLQTMFDTAGLHQVYQDYIEKSI